MSRQPAHVVAVAEDPSTGSPFTARTAWVRKLETPLRLFLQTESGSAAVLLATVVALVWANVAATSYERVWRTTFVLARDDAALAHSLRYWLSSGLMTLFFCGGRAAPTAENQDSSLNRFATS